MGNFKAFTSISVIALLSFALSGCVSESYSYDGYRNYDPSYGGYYSGSDVIYRSGPRYNSRYYRDNRYYRNDSYRERARSRPERRPENTRPTYRSDKRLIVVPSSNQSTDTPNNSGPMRIFKRESHN